MKRKEGRLEKEADCSSSRNSKDVVEKDFHKWYTQTLRTPRVSESV